MTRQFFFNKTVMIIYWTLMGYVFGFVAGAGVEVILGFEVGLSDWSILKVLGATIGVFLGAIIGKTVDGTVFLMLAKTIRTAVLICGLIGFGLGVVATIIFHMYVNFGIIEGGIIGLVFGIITGIVIGAVIGILRALVWMVSVNNTIK